jgi:hypothetical protein
MGGDQRNAIREQKLTINGDIYICIYIYTYICIYRYHRQIHFLEPSNMNWDLSKPHLFFWPSIYGETSSPFWLLKNWDFIHQNGRTIHGIHIFKKHHSCYIYILYIHVFIFLVFCKWVILPIQFI